MSIGSNSSSSSGSSGSAGPDTTRRIKLTPSFQRYFVANVVDGYRFRIVASDENLMPKEIFRYYRYPANALTGALVDECTGVCSWMDLEELPTGEPRDTDCPQAYRLSYVDQVVESKHAALEAWELYQQDVRLLKETLDFGDTLDEAEAVWIGTEP